MENGSVTKLEILFFFPEILVLNYCEVYDVLTLVGEQLMEECIIIKAKADMS